jgi:transcriptional regulator with XRE-family HTH domain
LAATDRQYGYGLGAEAMGSDVGPRHVAKRAAGLTGSRRPSERPVIGAVSGHILKIIRERLPLTQELLAESLGVDKTTLQGWESGRRPLLAASSVQVAALRRQLLRLGAEPSTVQLLSTALEDDLVLGHLLGVDDERIRVDDHPLAAWVLSRDDTHMIVWALTGVRPAVLPESDAVIRRGPVPNGPLLGSGERARAFAHLRRAAEVAGAAGARGALLRRQALYLSSYDRTDDTSRWLSAMRGQSRRTVAGEWSPGWAEDRSLAASLSRHGDRETVRRFVAEGMGSEAGETANLNYWAYWLGVDRTTRPNDTFMSGAPAHWDPVALLRCLADRLDPDLGCLDLNVHSVWALISSRGGILAADRCLNQRLASSVAALLDGDAVSDQSRRELEAVHYGLKLSRT